MYVLEDYADKDNVIGFTTAFINEELDENDWFNSDNDKISQFIFEKLNQFIRDLDDELEGIVDDRILIQLNDKLQEYKSDMLVKNVDDMADTVFFVKINKEVPAEDLNSVLLNFFNDYSFYAIFENAKENNMVGQGYSHGEFDTGYFANDSESIYIDDFGFPWEHYQEAQKLLIN